MEEPTGTWLEIDLHGEAIAGRLHDGERAPRPFSGWLELVAVLEEARECQADEGTDRQAPSRRR